MTTKLSFLLSAALTVVPAIGQGLPDGNDINTAIPIYFGQVLSDTIDTALKPRQVYQISLARGQTVRATMTLDNAAPVALIAVTLIEPGRKTLSSCNWGCNSVGLANNFTNGGRGVGWSYQVPVAGDYYVVLFTGSSGVNYRFQVTAEGTPLVTTLPVQAGCLTGQVDYVKYSLRLIAMGLPDEVSVGGVAVCAGCPVKPPLYSQIVDKMEAALKANVPVEVCYDPSGSIFQIKLTHP